MLGRGGVAAEPLVPRGAAKGPAPTARALWIESMTPACRSEPRPPCSLRRCSRGRLGISGVEVKAAHVGLSSIGHARQGRPIEQRPGRGARDEQDHRREQLDCVSLLR